MTKQRRIKGSGTTFKYKDKWFAELEKKRITCHSEREAIRALGQLQKEAKRNEGITTPNVTLRAYLKQYEELYIQNGSTKDSTKTNNLHNLKYIYADKHLSSKKLSQLTPNDFQRFFLNVRTHRGTMLATETQRHLRSILNQAFNSAVDNDLMRRNVVQNIEIKKIPSKQQIPLTMQEITKLDSIAKEHRLYHVYTLMLHMGLRLGEALALQWSDIDFDKGYLSINKTYSKSDTSFHIGTTKTTGSNRYIPIPLDVLDILKRAYILRDKKTPWIAPVKYLKGNTTKTPISGDNFRRLVNSWCKAVGIRNIHPHLLRHTFITQAVHDNVISIDTLAHFVGHTNIVTLMKKYVHHSNDWTNVASGLNNLYAKKVA